MTPVIIFKVLVAIVVIALILKFAEKFLSWIFQFSFTWFLLLGGAIYAIYHFWGGEAAAYAVIAYILYIIYQRW